jgi:hypothetical protein
MKDHVKVIGILWVIFGAFWLCLAVFALLVFLGVAMIPNVEDISPAILRLIGIIVSSFMGLMGLPQIIGGLGLINHKEWARILVLVLAFLALVNVPFGTALGIYTLVVLFNPETVRLFQGGAPAAPQPPK